MDDDRFDALSRRFGARGSRRAALGALTASGVFGAIGLATREQPAAAAPAAQQTTCTIPFTATVRMGDGQKQTLAKGATKAGVLQGKLSFSLADTGDLQNGELTLDSGTKLPVVGQATGHSLQLRVALANDTALVAVGVGEQPISACKGAIDGMLSGPNAGDLGDWSANVVRKESTSVIRQAGGGVSDAKTDKNTDKNKDKDDTQNDDGTCKAGLSPCGSECVDLTVSNENCGACGTACPDGSRCTAGVCKPTSGGDTGECTGNKTNCSGTCVNLNSDAANCGACGNVCAAGQECAKGVCGGGESAQCADGETLCANGVCKNLFNDNFNCGECGVACADNQTCIQGACQNMLGTDCASQGLTACGEACFDLATDANNCGACGAACAEGQVCAAGVCQQGGVGGDCASRNLTDCGGGVCADLASDPANCGACGAVCSSGQTCAAGACAGESGGGGGGGCSDPSLTACNGVCVDLVTDDNNCGACNSACPAGQVCSGGRCIQTSVAPSCADRGLTNCSGACVDTTADPANCGGCGNTCAAGATCQGGVCGGAAAATTSQTPDCAAQGLTLCGGACVNLQTDESNCGDCGASCAGAACRGGICGG